MSAFSIAEMALSFSTNTCFGLMSSKWGNQNAGKLGAGTVTFGIASLVLGIIGQAQKQQPPPQLTKPDLKAANDALRAQIADDRFQDEVIDKLAPLQVLAIEVDTALTRAMGAVKSDNRFDPELDDQLNKDWADYYAAFKKVDGYQQDCLITAQWVEDNENRKFDTMDLYQLASSLYLNINQICLMVEWNAILNDPKQGQTWRKAYVKYRHDYKAYKKDHEKWLKEQQEVIGENWDKYSPGGPDSGNPGFYWSQTGGITNAAG